jgi:predicted nuclease with TOPRIM domain
MDSEQLQELTTNALLDHWPPHLGVKTEAEKVAYLVSALSEVEVKNGQIEALENQIETMEEEAADLENRLDSRDDQIKKLETKIDELNEQIAELKAKQQ